MNERETTLAIELLVNHLVHLRSHVQILQEQLVQRGVNVHDEVERELDRHWTESGNDAVAAFWVEFEGMKRDQE
ncbi:MAG: hypothetical protein ACREI3_09830 [Nitrospirales bacterium]